jgi:cytochrome P450
MKTPAEFDFFDPALQANPLEFFAALRAQAPVYREPRTGAYFITRAADIREVVAKPEIFSNQIDPSLFRVCQGLSLEQRDPEVAARLKEKAWLVPHTLLLTDPPVHGRFRRLAMEALSPKAVKRLEPFIQSQIERYMTALDSETEVDFLAEFAEKLPLSIILRFLGGAEEDLPKVNRWADQFFSTMMALAPRDEYMKSVDAIAEILQLVAARMEQVRRQPDDSLLHALMHAHEATGDAPLTLEETLSIFQVLLMAGHDTTRQTLTNAVGVLAASPDLFKQLQADRELVKPFIEEVVRMYSPANVTSRYTMQDCEVGGVSIPKDSSVFICWGSANRDEQTFESPDQFLCPRDGGGAHLGFGFGIHFCVGVRLARLQLSMTIDQLLDRYERIELAIPKEQLQYLPAINLRALMQMPIRCHRAAVAA